MSLIHTCMSHTHSRPMSWVSVCGVCDMFLYLFGSRQQGKSLERGRQRGESFPVCLAFFFFVAKSWKNVANVQLWAKYCCRHCHFLPSHSRGETNSTRTNPHILHVQVLNINNNGEERNTADLWLSMFITDDTPPPVCHNIKMKNNAWRSILFAVGLSGKQQSATSADPQIRITTTKHLSWKKCCASKPLQARSFSDERLVLSAGKNALVETAQRALHTVAGAVQIERSCCESRLCPVVSYGQ